VTLVTESMPSGRPHSIVSAAFLPSIPETLTNVGATPAVLSRMIFRIFPVQAAYYFAMTGDFLVKIVRHSEGDPIDHGAQTEESHIYRIEKDIIYPLVSAVCVDIYSSFQPSLDCHLEVPCPMKYLT